MGNILENFKKDNCCGCTACKNVCPKHAISMIQDEKGFIYPSIDSSKCINCGLCVKACSFKSFSPKEKEINSYIYQIKDINERLHSQSGGAFFAIASYIIKHKGYVFGCELNKNFEAVHNCYNTLEGINKFRGSKYVMSNLNDCFNKCYELLKKKKMVLFSGTGCQVHSLLSFLKCKNCNTNLLYTCDIVCHGSPSPEAFKAYLEFTKLKTKKDITSFNFRDKKIGWYACNETISFSDGTSLTCRYWASLFGSCTLFRDSCYNCKYTTYNRDSDITISDAWIMSKERDELDDNKGTSLILPHTDKGEYIVKEILKQSGTLLKVDANKYSQPQLNHPAKKGIYYNDFWKLFNKDRNKAIKVYSSNKFILNKLFRKLFIK